MKEEKLNAKVLAKAELVSKELARRTLVKNRHKTLNWWSEEDCIWWSKGKKGRNSCLKGKNNISEGGLNTYHHEKSSINDLQSC